MSQKSGLHPLSRKHNIGMSPRPSRFRVKNEKKTSSKGYKPPQKIIKVLVIARHRKIMKK